MLKNKRILLTLLMVVLLLLIPNIVKAGGEFVDRVDITGTIPTECILGEKATVPDDITVRINGTINMEVTDVYWDVSTEHGGGVMEPSDVFTDALDNGDSTSYGFYIGWKRPKGFAYTEDTKLYINGVERRNVISSFLAQGHEEYDDHIYFDLGKAFARINYNPEDVQVIIQERGEIGMALEGDEVAVFPKKDVDDWDITIMKEGGMAIVPVKLTGGNGQSPYYKFTMPAEDVTITAEYTYDKEEAKEEQATSKEETKEETKAEKDKTPKTGLAGNKTSFIGIGIAGLVLISGAVTIIKKK